MKKLLLAILIPIFTYAYQPPQDVFFNGPFAASDGGITQRKTFPFHFTVLYSSSNYVYKSDWTRRKTVITENIHPYFSLKTGIFKWMDLTIGSGMIHTKQKSNKSISWTDTALNAKFRIFKEGKYLPKANFAFTETVPSGKYNDLNKSKLSLDASGAGAFQSMFGLNMSKTINLKRFPFQLLFNIMYSFPSKVEVFGYNAYGGINVNHQVTRGFVKPGKLFITNLSIDISLTKKLDFSMDAIFANSSKIRFKGRFGVLIPGFHGSIPYESPTTPFFSSNNTIPLVPIIPSLGEIESITAPSSTIISLTPSLGYAFSDKFNALLTYWTSVAGRNTSAFNSIALTLSYTF
ncbi:MAG: hypothetical protein K1060chlam5_00295 [Candidatus Anoxychlamydiales bacterium]|nr:hypothetical protein [Candidatus Anoxychlamydiales bacterium]